MTHIQVGDWVRCEWWPIGLSKLGYYYQIGPVVSISRDFFKIEVILSPTKAGKTAEWERGASNVRYTKLTPEEVDALKVSLL